MSRTWHAVLVAILLASFGVQVGLLLAGGQDVNSGQASAHLDVPTRFVRLFSYFTIQSNLIVLAMSALLVINPSRDGAAWRVLRLDALLGITITGIIFATLLSGIVHHQGIGVWVNAGFHYASPIMTVAGWLMFGPRGCIDARTIALAFAWPLAWVAYTFIHGAMSGWYPYPFLDAGTLGYAKALMNVGWVMLLAIVLAGVFSVIDRHLPGRVRVSEQLLRS